LALIVLLPLLSLAIVYVLPRSYQATAALWALRRYEVIGATGSDSDPLSTPAQTQATALSGLLQTRSFALSIGRATALASTFDASTQANPQLRDDALFREVSQHVQVAAQGYALFTITYTNRNPEVAQQVVKAVIQDYGVQSQEINAGTGQHLLQSYQVQLVNAKHDLDAATAAESQYINTHPNLTQAQMLTDPQYVLLQTQVLQATSTLQNIQSSITMLRQEIGAQGTGADSLFKVIDAPVMPRQPVSRLGLFLLAGGLGLGIAILACTLYIIILVRSDRAVYTTLDLQKATTFPVITQLPQLAPEAVPVLVNVSVNRRYLAEGRRALDRGKS